MGDSPLVNYFIMAWQSCSTAELRGVLLPAHHSYLDNLVNKGHTAELLTPECKIGVLMRATRTKERQKREKATVEKDSICYSYSYLWCVSADFELVARACRLKMVHGAFQCVRGKLPASVAFQTQVEGLSLSVIAHGPN